MTLPVDIEALLDDELSKELEEWLNAVASTCVNHMQYIHNAEKSDPEALSVEDYSLLELERAFLTLFALRKGTDGGVPKHDKHEIH